jgi:DNA-binding CsgD family transcriptional regulator
VEDLVDRIYEAAAVPELWPDVLERLTCHFDTRVAQIFRMTAHETSLITHGFPEGVEEFLFSHPLMRDNPRFTALVARQHAGFLTDFDFYSEAEILASPFYSELVIPNGVYPGAATLLRGARSDAVVFALEGFRDNEACAKAVPTLDVLRPHVARASVLAAQLQAQQGRAMVTALTAVGAAAAILDERGGLRDANAAFGAQIGRRLYDGRPRLRLEDSSADAAFRDGVARAARDARGCSIALRASEAFPAAVLHLVPVRRAGRDVFTGAAVLALLCDGQTPGILGLDLLQALFDLTPAEARVARALADGLSPGEIATRLNLSILTIRTHIRAIMAKSGHRRAAELVRVLSSLAQGPSGSLVH